MEIAARRPAKSQIEHPVVLLPLLSKNGELISARSLMSITSRIMNRARGGTIKAEEEDNQQMLQPLSYKSSQWRRKSFPKGARAKNCTTGQQLTGDDDLGAQVQSHWKMPAFEKACWPCKGHMSAPLAVALLILTHLIPASNGKCIYFQAFEVRCGYMKVMLFPRTGNLQQFIQKCRGF